MSEAGGIIKKEVKELLTLQTLIPIIIFALIFGMLGTAFGGINQTLYQKPVIGLIDNDHGELSAIANQTLRQNAIVVYNGTSVDEGLNVIDAKKGFAVILIPSNFTEDINNNRSATVEVYWLMKGTGIADTVPLGTVDALISVTRTNISKHLIEGDVVINSTVILSPLKISDTTIVKGKELSGISPDIIGSMMATQGFIIPLIVLMVITMAGSMVITSMGTEKENKTLETLLTLPIRRSSIVFGKLAGAAIVGLIMAIIYMLGMANYMSAFSGSSPIDLAKLGLSLDLSDYLLVGISLFLALLAALSLCMILGIFTKNYKAAQTMTLPITILALVPMFINLTMDFDTMPVAAQVIVFAIPFSHPMMAVRALMFDNTGLVLVGIGYELLFTLVAMFIAVTLFKKDILLTGRVKSSERKRTRFPLIDLIRRKR